MTDTTELIQRLRHLVRVDRDEIGMYAEAADALEQQAAQIEALRADAERLRRVSDAAAVYYEHYMQDEADSPEYCVCGDEQHQRAVEVRDSLAALRQEQPT